MALPQGSHTLATSMDAVKRPRPSWENATTCAASAEEQAQMKAETARDSVVRAETDRRAGARKQPFVPDS
jgi:hypothetical protein